MDEWCFDIEECQPCINRMGVIKLLSVIEKQCSDFRLCKTWANIKRIPYISMNSRSRDEPGSYRPQPQGTTPSISHPAAPTHRPPLLPSPTQQGAYPSLVAPANSPQAPYSSVVSPSYPSQASYSSVLTPSNPPPVQGINAVPPPNHTPAPYPTLVENASYRLPPTPLLNPGFSVRGQTVGQATRSFNAPDSSSRPRNTSMRTRPPNTNNETQRAQRGRAHSRRDTHFERVSNPTNGASGYTNMNQHKKIGCFNCGEFNHRRSTCRYDHKIRCEICHALGHKSRLCNYYNN